jgi:hypothetical protein
MCFLLKRLLLVGYGSYGTIGHITCRTVLPGKCRRVTLRRQWRLIQVADPGSEMRQYKRESFTSALAALCVASAIACSDTTAPESHAMTGILEGTAFHSQSSAMILTGSVADTLYVLGVRSELEEHVLLRIPYTQRGLVSGVGASALITHLLGGDVRVGEYTGTGTLTIDYYSEADSEIAGTFEFNTAATFGSHPRYGSTANFRSGRFRAKFEVHEALQY